jgi:predicted ATPase
VLAATRPEPAPGQSVEALLIEHLHDSRAMLVLDNCEHVAAACGRFVADLLRHCPALHVVATSRQTFGVPGEQTYAVPELSFPADTAPAAETRQFESVRLFVDRAALTRPGFELSDANAESVGAICRKLEGHPMAIELAAARVAALPIEMVAAHLFEVLDPTQVLESSIAWSVKLLSDAERTLLGRLAVFRGGWTLESAEAVCGDGRPVILLLSRLVEQSLVRYVVRAGRARYWLLETMRQHALQHLHDDAAAVTVRDGHLEHFLALALEANEHFSSAEEAAWLDRLEIEHGNLREGLDHAMREASDPAHGVALATALHVFWSLRGYCKEGRAWLERAIARRGDAADLAQMRAMNALGILQWRCRENVAADQSYQRALGIARELRDQPRAAAILTNLGVLANETGNHARSRGFHTEALEIYEELNQPIGVAYVRLNLANTALSQEEWSEARRLAETCLSTFRETGDSQRIAAALHNLGQAAGHEGDLEEAELRLRECLEIRRELRDKEAVAGTVLQLAGVAARQGNHLRAARLLAAAESLRTAIGTPVKCIEMLEFERVRDELRRRLDEASRLRAWDVGSSLSFDEAIGYAVHDQLPDASEAGGGST